MIETSPNGVDHTVDLFGWCGTCGRAHDDWDDGAARVMGSDAARAVGRFNPAGLQGYKASSLPEPPTRQTRAEAVSDERQWRELPHYVKDAHDIDWMATGQGVVKCKCGETLGECPTSGPERINAAGALRREHWHAVTTSHSVPATDK